MELNFAYSIFKTCLKRFTVISSGLLDYFFHKYQYWLDFVQVLNLGFKDNLNQTLVTQHTTWWSSFSFFFISELFTPNNEDPPPSLVQLPVNSLPFFVWKTKLVLFGSGFLPTWLPTWEQKTWKCIHFKTCLFFCTLWVITADTHSTSWPNTHTHTLGGSLSGSDRKWCPFSFQVCLGLIVSNGNFRNLNRRRTQNCWL